MHDVNRLMIEALKSKENVMFPVSPSGIILDLLEIVMDLLDRERLGTHWGFHPFVDNSFYFQIGSAFTDLKKALG